MMTPGDFASLQEGREGLSTEDYIAWKLPEEEEEADGPAEVVEVTSRAVAVRPDAVLHVRPREAVTETPHVS